MKVLIIYFSGTGNTYYCANYIKEHLARNGNEISMYSACIPSKTYQKTKSAITIS